MAATNYTPIQLYYSTTASAAPVAGNLTNGELAINITDGKLYYKDNSGTVQVIATKGAGTIGGSNTQIQYNNSGALAGNAAMTFNSATSTVTLTTLNLTNALGATYGGTAQSSYTQGDLLYSSATNTLSKLGIGTVDYILTSTGSVPQWSAPSSISVLTATNLAGGAGGSVPYQSAASTTTFLAIGAANRVMTSTGSAPQWVTALTGLTGVSSSSITNTSLTSGRVVYSTTGGAQTDDADLTFNGTTLSAGGYSTSGLSTLVKTVTIGNSNFDGSAVFAAATPAKLYIGTGTVTDTTSAIGATNAVGAISSLAITPIAATNTSVTYTNAATLYIAGAPSAGTNVTLTNPYALYVAAGASYFGGAVTYGAGLTLGGNLLFSPDDTYDIGAAGATRARNLYLAGSGNIVGTLFKPEGSFIQWNSTGLTGGTNRAIVWADSSSNLYLGTGSGNSTVATFNATGVGIGTAPSTSLQVAGNALVGTSTSGGLGAQTGLTVVGGATVSDNTPGALTLGSHGNARTVNSEIGKIDFYSNDASGGASGVQASIRGVTETALGESAGLRFYTGTAASLGTAGSVNYLQQWGLGSGGSDGNFRLTLTGAAGDSNGLSIYETSTGNNARLRISQGAAAVYYNATYSGSGNYHNFQIGNGTVAYIDSNGVNVSAGSTAFLTGSLGSRLWTPGLAIGTGTYSGLYGPSLTYLAEKSGSSWVSTGGGAAGALGIDEGFFYFARSQGVGGPGTTLTWTTYLNSDGGGNFFFNSTGLTKVASGNTAARPTATAGGLRWNTTIPQLEVGDGTQFQKVVTEAIVTATGGTVTTDGDYKVHTFTTSGTFTISAIAGAARALVEIMVVGGGGGGGFYLGGGGGGGGFVQDFFYMTATSYSVTVGAGGASTSSGLTYSSNGGASYVTGGTLGTLAYVYGGGAGSNGAANDAWGANGNASRSIGSGGGGGSPYGFTLSTATVQALFGGSAGRGGSGGGYGTLYGSGTTFNGGGGGGGSLGAGVAPNVGNGPVGAGGYGGTAITSNITGSDVDYAGGGGGGYGTYLANLYIGGGGGGAGDGVGSANSGANLSATAGTANRGGGGGGGQLYSGYQQGGSGGSGVVIIRYKYQ